jgi:hypothetical protein
MGHLSDLFFNYIQHYLHKHICLQGTIIVLDTSDIHTIHNFSSSALFTP